MVRVIDNTKWRKRQKYLEERIKFLVLSYCDEDELKRDEQEIAVYKSGKKVISILFDEPTVRVNDKTYLEHAMIFARYYEDLLEERTNVTLEQDYS